MSYLVDFKHDFATVDNGVIVPLGAGTDYITNPSANVAKYNLALMDGSAANITVDMGPDKISTTRPMLVKLVRIMYLGGGGTLSVYPQGFGFDASPLTNGIRVLVIQSTDGGSTWTEAADHMKYICDGSTHVGAIRRNIDWHLLMGEVDDTPYSRDESREFIRTWRPDSIFGDNGFVLRNTPGLKERLAFVIRDDLSKRFGTIAYKRFLVFMHGKLI